MIYTNIKRNDVVVGVYFNGNSLLSARIENGKLVKTYQADINSKESEDFIVNEIFKSIESVNTEDVAGIGIGVPSIVETTQGILYNAINIPSWKEVYLRDILEERFNKEVKVNNDANCFILGEYYFGSAKNLNNVVGLILGFGVGCGLLLNGKLYEGMNCGAGEFGNIPYKEHDLEYYCSTGYFVEKYGLTFDIVKQRAENNDKIALAIFEQYGIDLGNAIKIILYSIDPEMIVIGGIISNAFRFYENSMMKTIMTFRYKHIVEKIKIRVEDKSLFMPVLGAGALFFRQNDDLNID